MNAISINNHELGIKEFNNQRVVTLKDIDVVHERPDGTAGRNFRKNRKYFIENEDFYHVNSNRRISSIEKIPPKGIILITESGYMMLVKSFTDDLAWDVQRKLVKSYFRVKEEQPEPAAIPETTIIIKTYKGQTVLTVRDMTALTGIHRDSINHYLRKHDTFVKGVDYMHISGLELQRFKHVNDGVSHMMNGLNLITLKGAMKIALYSAKYSPELENQISLLYGKNQTENVLEEPPKQLDNLPQRYVRITEAQMLLDTAGKINDPYYREYIYKMVTEMMIKGSSKEGEGASPESMSLYFKLGEILAKSDKKGRERIKSKILADLKNKDEIASANEFFILAESVLAE